MTTDVQVETIEPVELLIGGEWRAAAGGGRIEVEDPGSRRVLTTAADAAVEDALAALDAASAAAAGWAATPARERGEVLRRTFDLLVDRGEEFARLLTLEMGRPLAESRGEVAYGAEFFRWYAEEAVRINGRYGAAPAGNARILTSPRPVGPCLLIAPWNFPLAMATRKIGPALAAGCTAVLKPARETPLTSRALAELMEEAGLPAGVLNVITTSRPREVVAALLADPRLRKVSFTGSTEVGKELVRAAAGNLLRTSMELGGNAPLVVFEDADLDLAVREATLAKMRNTGQSCVAANRMLVAAPIAAEFGARLAAAIGEMPIGHGLEPGTEVGPLIDAAAGERLGGLVAEACEAGATMLLGAERDLPERGHFFAPAVLADVPADARILHEEAFGPVAPIVAFDTEEEALALANATPFGLASYVFTADMSRALRVIDGIEAGMVGINRGMISDASAPFGGIKQSGLGREGGPEGLAEYLSLRYASLAI
ncbi:MAG: NAD-dependent succinate-semialdehyde dehydrogenase [Actinobacteria bacterium]|nr:NAD-dependent succinate-semialdehyde dehydrogenase [Actinomycetota bacterium]